MVFSCGLEGDSLARVIQPQDMIKMAGNISDFILFLLVGGHVVAKVALDADSPPDM
jgi:hypothetical protein